MQAWRSPGTSGNMAIFKAISVTEVLDMADTPDGFSERLRTLRKQKNLSQTELGQLAGLHYTHIGRFERGTSRPGSDTLRRLADALGVSGDYLLEGATEEAAKARFEDRELLKQFQEVERLPAEDKHVVKTLLDAFLTKKQLQTLVR
jgi:transcriptional regulator with XRE-family HTH domain